MRTMAAMMVLLSATMVFAQPFNNLLIDPASPMPKMIEIPQYTVPSEKSVYADIMSHCNPRALNRAITGYSRKTNGHETTHMIQANMRNDHGGRVEGIYLLNGKGVILKQPGIRQSLALRFIPKSLRASRVWYVSDSNWEDTPLHLLNEWNCYIHDCLIGADDVPNGRDDERNVDAAVGTLEMGIYAIGLAMAVEKHDKEYWDSEPEFKTFMRFQWRRAKAAYDKGAPLFPWDTQDRILKDLRTSPDAEEMRAFIRTRLDGVWLDD